jgi:hypothetical protein
MNVKCLDDVAYIFLKNLKFDVVKGKTMPIREGMALTKNDYFEILE